jgi:D-3-phosphoglycerate dehydrogenase
VADPFAGPLPEGVTLVELPELLARSRVVSLHARLTAETQGLIGAAELALMPRGAVLVNTARGALVDTDALTAALESRHLGGAGLDVYEPEPLPASHPLRSAPNTLLVPHLAGATRQTADRAIRMAVEEVARWYRSEPLAYAVAPPPPADPSPDAASTRGSSDGAAASSDRWSGFLRAFPGSTIPTSRSWR